MRGNSKHNRQKEYVKDLGFQDANTDSLSLHAIQRRRLDTHLVTSYVCAQIYRPVETEVVTALSPLVGNA